MNPDGHATLHEGENSPSRRGSVAGGGFGDKLPQARDVGPADSGSDKRPSTPLIAIVGPTGTGKSDLADRLAHRYGGELVSADSMQVYRGMDIGTAKLPPEQRSVPYHCLDLVTPGTPYSAALYQRDARAAIDGIHHRDGRAVICGGTGLYLRAALDDFAFPAGEQAHNPARAHYTALAQELGSEGLHALLAEQDPASAALIHPNNTRRIIRAFEMLADGKDYATQLSGFSSFAAYYETLYIGLTASLPVMYGRIERRVDEMIAAGLEDEVASLCTAGFEEGLTAPQAIGYKEFVAVKHGVMTRDEAIAAIKQATRRYAKRQRTWFKRDPRIKWIDIEGRSPQLIEEMAWGLIEQDTP